MDNAEFLYSVLPDWVKNVEQGLDPSMYGTLSEEGDLEAQIRATKIINAFNELHELLKIIDEALEIPSYAYGNNEAAVKMAYALHTIKDKIKEMIK